MTENPYDPPREKDALVDEPMEPSVIEDVSDEKDEPASDPFPHFIPVVQFSMRLLGIYLVVIGAAGLLEDAINIFVFLQYDPGSFTIYHSRFAASGLYFGAGLYLILGGRWLIERVFLPVNRTG